MAEHEAFFASCWLHGVHLIVTVIRLSSSCGHGGRRQLAAMATAAKPVQYNTMPGSAHAPTACPHCTQPHRSAPSSISEVGVWAALPLVQCQSANAYRFHVCKWKFLTIALYLLFRVSSLDPPSHFVSCLFLRFPLRTPDFLVAPRPHLPNTRTWQTRTFLPCCIRLCSIHSAHKGG